MHNCELQYASLVNNRFSIVFESLSLTICSIPINLKSDKSCGVLLKCVATSHVLLLLIIVDLWLRKRTFSSVLVDPMYCNVFLRIATNVLFNWVLYPRLTTDKCTRLMHVVVAKVTLLSTL